MKTHIPSNTLILPMVADKNLVHFTTSLSSMNFFKHWNYAVHFMSKLFTFCRSTVGKSMLHYSHLSSLSGVYGRFLCVCVTVIVGSFRTLNVYQENGKKNELLIEKNYIS